MPPYPYLANPPEQGSDTIINGTNLIKGDAIVTDLQHSFNENMKIKLGFTFWDNHGVSIWEWEDVEIDFMGESGNKLVLMFEDRIANNVFLSLKFRYKRYNGQELEWRTWANGEQAGEDYYFTDVQKTEKAIRLQVDYKF